MNFDSFKHKWNVISGHTLEDKASEKTLFVKYGAEPITQRQLNLYYYFIFISELLKDDKIRDVLEVGCGRGTMSLYLRDYLSKNVSLLDNVQEAIDLARDEFSTKGQSANFFVGDALDMQQFTNNSFDATISIGLAEHVDNVEKLFSEQYRVLRPGGIMISLNIPKKFSIQFLNIIWRSIKKMIGTYKKKVRSDYYRNKLQAKDYQKIARKVGFQNVNVMYVCPFPLFSPLDIFWDKKVTKIFKFILKIRKIFQGYPYKTSALIGQAHFLVGSK